MGPIHHGPSKVYTRRTNGEAVCLAVLFFCVLPMHTNIVTNKGFNLFDECSARRVHLFPQEKQCTSSSRGYSKMCTSGIIGNSQRMLTEINKRGAIAKIRIWVESDAVKHLKAFRIISSKMKISLLILSWWNFSCLRIQRIDIQYTDQSFWKIMA